MNLNILTLHVCLLITFALTASTYVRADSMTITSSADSEIAEAAPTTPRGTNVTMVSGGLGNLAGNVHRRALLRFDLGAVPNTATVTSVVVRVKVVKAPPSSSAADSNFELHPLLKAWSELSATWTWPISSGQNWSGPGAGGATDAGSSNANVHVSSLGTYTFNSTPGLVADVQGWLAIPSSNNGWLLRSDTEAPYTARHFGTHESGASAPVLVVGFRQNTPPSVSITNPPANSSFNGPTLASIEASATDPDGTVTNVQFFDGTVSLGNISAPPFRLPFMLTNGPHTLTAAASDNLGATATSAPVNVTVTGGLYLPSITKGNIAVLLQPIATGLAAPDYAISPPDDTNRLFVVEQNGLLRIIQNGALLAGAALDIQSRVQPPLDATRANDERGFLGLAFHPGFNNPASPGFKTLYTYNSELIPEGTTPTYVAPNGATNRYKNVINEWKISAVDPNVVDPASRREIISFGKEAGNHNGGTITFGPDGYLYLALGDGGNGNDVGPSHIEPGGNAQNLSTPLGKMLRLDPLQPALTPASPDPVSANGQYRIPSDNPFLELAEVPEIYAYGFRNPYRFSFDRGNGELIVADVGQNSIEEVDRVSRGGNYGWAVKEGDFLFNRTTTDLGTAGTVGPPPGNRSPGSPAGLIDPISGPLGTLEYDHGDGISITGGFVYRGKAIPELVGKYVFGDLALRARPTRVDGRLFYADLQTGLINEFLLPQFPEGVLTNGVTVHGFGQDGDGELYALVTNTSANGTGGVVYKFLPAVRVTLQLSGNMLDLSWPVGWRLQAQTNSPGLGLGSNWVTFPDSDTTTHLVVPADPANGSVFYRLTTP